MKNVSIEELNRNVIALRKVIEKISEVILEDDMKLSDEVAIEIERSRSAPENDFISQEDIEAEFLNED